MVEINYCHLAKRRNLCTAVERSFLHSLPPVFASPCAIHLQTTGGRCVDVVGSSRTVHDTLDALVCYGLVTARALSALSVCPDCARRRCTKTRCPYAAALQALTG